jgi:glycogen synthase
VKGCDAPPSWHRYHHAVQTGLHSADKVVAPSQWMLAALQSFYGPFDTGTVVYNGRRASRFPRGVKDPFLFTAGRLWDEGKNVAALTRIAPFLPWPVFLAGESANPGGSDGSDSPSPKRAQVYRLGHISEQKLACWLSRAALYVLPAKYEPFGLSAVEAGLAGCALVLSDIPSLREIWENAAVFVPPDDDQALQSCLERLIRDEPTRQTLAARAQQRALHFSATHMASGYLALYDTLLQSKNSQWKKLRKDRPCVL